MTQTNQNQTSDIGRTQSLNDENDFATDPSGTTGHLERQNKGLSEQPVGGDAVDGKMTGGSSEKKN